MAKKEKKAQSLKEKISTIYALEEKLSIDQ